MKRIAGVAAATGGGLGFLYGYSPETFFSLMDSASGVAHNQIAQAGFFFTLAALIHSSRVKTEIKNAFSSLTESINNLGTGLTQLGNELKDHQKLLDLHGKAIAELQTKQGGISNG